MRKNIIRVILTLAAVAIASATTTSAQTFSKRQNAANGLAGTSWKLVKLQAGDETTSVPDDGSKYTITFGTDGRVVSRVDCNRGSSTWKSTGANELQFGSWSRTSVKCPAGSLHDKIVTEGGECALVLDQGRASGLIWNGGWRLLRVGAVHASAASPPLTLKAFANLSPGPGSPGGQPARGGSVAFWQPWGSHIHFSKTQL